MANPYTDNPYIWTNNSMEDGVAPCNPDITNDCLMWLWYEMQRLSYEVSHGGTAGEIRAFATSTAPEGWLIADGTAVARSTYDQLDLSIYCGNTLNPTADWGYRTTSISSPSTNRSITGQYIVLPDCRGRLVRALDLGKGLDSGRSLWSYQSDSTALPKNTGTPTKLNGDGSTTTTFANVTDPTGSQCGFARVSKSGDGSNVAGSTLSGSTYPNRTDVLNIMTGDPETRPVNVAMLLCIKF